MINCSILYSRFIRTMEQWRVWNRENNRILGDIPMRSPHSLCNICRYIFKFRTTLIHSADNKLLFEGKLVCCGFDFLWAITNVTDLFVWKRPSIIDDFLFLQDKTIIETAVIPWYMCILDMGPVVYAGSALLWLAAFAVCLTYVTCHQ